MKGKRRAVHGAASPATATTGLSPLHRQDIPVSLKVAISAIRRWILFERTFYFGCTQCEIEYDWQHLGPPPASFGPLLQRAEPLTPTSNARAHSSPTSGLRGVLEMLYEDTRLFGVGALILP
ncbi:hypothetical protein CTheo_7143 [Ceratobasidium theobromae]|uniref:Uncharacterized protein n=1 Tax=Ceratobasidium theobromae TaxID=1582974 RepID=A0A5N5QD93_9AGAM|nr:hypothetical protein CTheo_7143 [Ceratobasidium theobromae]